MSKDNTETQSGSQEKTLIFLNIDPAELDFRLDAHRSEAYELDQLPVSESDRRDIASVLDVHRDDPLDYVVGLDSGFHLAQDRLSKEEREAACKSRPRSVHPKHGVVVCL